MEVKTEKVYSILELNTTVRRFLKLEFPDYIWVCGEVQDLKMSRDKRHIYFNLAQKHPEVEEIVAQVSAKIFEGYKEQIFKRLEDIDPTFTLKNEIEIKVKCEVDLYPKTGSFGLIVVDIDPYYTLGKIAQTKQRIIEELRKKGLLDKNKGLTLARVPLRVGLITAEDSAAYHDFIDELKKSRFSFKVWLYNCYMQGSLTERSVLSALKFFNRFPPDFLDVIVISRGGGSSAELSSFDNQTIAEAIALSKFPVITALGHQINLTIADLVAHTSLKTPTKGAQFLIETVRSFMQEVEKAKERILRLGEGVIGEEKKGLKDLTLRIETNLSKYFKKHHLEISKKELSLLNLSKGFFLHKKRSLKESLMRLETLLSRYFRRQAQELLERRFRLDNLWRDFLIRQRKGLADNLNILKNHIDNFLKSQKEDLKHKQEKLKLLDPKNILCRGYSITLKEGKALKDIDKIEDDDIIETILYRGIFISQVVKKEKDG